jgi:hypothetical protein
MSRKKPSTKTSKDLFNYAQANPSFQINKKAKLKAGNKESNSKTNLGRRHQKLT